MAFCSKFFRHLIASSLLQDALISETEPFYLRRDMLCQGVTVWTKNLNWSTGYFAYRTPLSFPHRCRLWILEGLGNSRSRNKDDRSTTTSRTSHTSHQYAPRSKTLTQGSKIKEAPPIGHPPLALAALSISNVALVGLRFHRMLSALQ
jgi:hypothetical protein